MLPVAPPDLSAGASLTFATGGLPSQRASLGHRVLYVAGRFCLIAALAHLPNASVVTDA